MAPWLCIGCGGARFNDERGAPSCERCAPILAEHVVSNQTDPATGAYIAVCPCGWTWSDGQPRSREQSYARGAAIVAHWRTQLGRPGAAE